jgi:hypothetical protein
MEEVMTWRHLYRILGGFLALLGFGTLVTAAPLNLQKTKETTQELTSRNAATLIGVSSAIPDEFRIEVIEIVQGLELSRDRIILFLDRMEGGVFPPEEGVERAVAIAKAQAQKEKEFLQALMGRVPPPAVPKVEQALTVSAESWQGVVAALRLSNREERQDLPSRPGTRFDLLLPPGLPTSPPPSR